jgi:hypothetical protein
LKLKLLFAATLGMGMLAHAGTVTTTLNVTIASSVPTFDDYLLFYSNGVAAFSPLGALPATTNLPGGVLSASYTVPGNFTSGYVTAIGLASSSDVVVALGSGISGSTITSGWSSIFLASESAIATDLATANTTALLAFLTSEYAHNSADFIAYSGTPGTGTVAEFSGVVVGSLTVNSGSAVPEPSTGALLGFGVGAVVLAGTLRRRMARVS